MTGNEILAYAIKTAIGLVITYLWSELRKFKEEQRKAEKERLEEQRRIEEQHREELKKMKKAMQALARDNLIRTYNIFIEQQWIPIYSLQTWVALYEAYEALGTNGVISGLLDQLKHLPNLPPRDTQEQQ